MRPEFCISLALWKRRGRREDRVRAAPAVSRAMCIKKCAHEHTGLAETLRPSPRNPDQLFGSGGLWRECALHGSVHPQPGFVTKRILLRLSFRQLLRLTGARICLLVQMVRRQKCDLPVATH